MPKYPSARTYDIVRTIKQLEKNTKALTVGPPPQPFGAVVTYSATAPLNPNIGDIWHNTADGNVASQWTGDGYDATVAGLSPIAWWKLADTANSTQALDASGFTHTGVPTNVTYGEPAPILGNTAALFNGTSSTVLSSFNPSFTAFSVEAWVNLGGLTQSGNPRIVANSHADADHNGFELFAVSGTTPRIVLGNGSGGTGTVTSGTTLPSTGWTYLAATWDGTTIRLYMNGLSVGSVLFAGPISTGTATGIGIGYGAAYAGDYLNGFISEVAVYSTALSATQIATNYSESQGAGWVPYQVGAGALEPTAITASALGYLGVLNANPYFLGEDPTGWAGFNGTFAVVTPPTGIPFSWCGQYINNGVTAGNMNEDLNAFPVQINQQYLVTAWVYSTDPDVYIGFDWQTGPTGGFTSTSTQDFTVAVNTWTQLTTVQTFTDITASWGAPKVGSNSLGQTCWATAILCLPQVPGTLVQAGTITALQVIAGIVVGGVVDGTGINGNSLVLNPGPLLVYGTPGVTFVTLTGSGNWTCPTGVTSIEAIVQAPGGGNNTGGFQFGAGGGECAIEPNLGVTPANLYAYNAPAATTGGGATATFAGDTVTVTAHGGEGSQSGRPGNGGNGSTNTTHYKGGNGGTVSGHPSSPGGGGGGGAGVSGPGGNGAQATISGGGGPGIGGSGFWRGGNGGHGGNSGVVGTVGLAPGGGAGGNGSGITTPKAGGNGQIILIYAPAASTASIEYSISPVAGTDPNTGKNYFDGITAYDLIFGSTVHITGDNITFNDVAQQSIVGIDGTFKHMRETASIDSISYAMQRLSLVTTASQTITLTSAVAITGLATPSALASGLTYHATGKIVYQGNQNAGVPTFSITGPTVSGNPLCLSKYYPENGGATSPLASYVRGGYPNDPGPTLVSAGFCEWEFDIVFVTSSSAVLTVKALTSIGGDSFIIQQGSWMEVFPQ
jgi:hypothetical protein